MHKIAKERDGECLSDEYINSYTPLKWKCNKDNNIWDAHFNSVVNQQTWCPVCSSCRSENLYRKYIEAKIGFNFPKSNPKWLKGLELDGYCKELGLAFEYNGIQHYEWVKYFHKLKQDFLNQQDRDKLKKKLCKKEGIKLIEIPYTFKYCNIEEMYDYIDEQIDLNNMTLKVNKLERERR